MNRYEITYDGNTFILTEDEFLSEEVQKELPEDIEWRKISKDSFEPVKQLPELERRADISSSPIASQLGADRVHASDVLSLANMYADEGSKVRTPKEDIEYVEYPVPESPRQKLIREMYTEGGLDKAIKQAQEQADVDEYYGWVRDNPYLSFGASMVAPSTFESIKEGKMPSLKDAAIDVPLALSAAYLPTLRGATMGATIAKNAAVGAGIGAATEGALQAAHEREFNPADIALSGAFGAGGGAGGGVLTGLADKRLANIVPVTEDRNYVFNKLGKTQEQTIKNLYEEAPRALKEMGTVSRKVKMPEQGDRMATRIVRKHIPYTEIDDLNKKVLEDIKVRRLKGDMDFETAERKRKILDDFNNSILDIASSYDRPSPATEKVPLSAMLSEAERLYKKDPEIGTDLIQLLQPHIEYINYRAEMAPRGGSTPHSTLTIYGGTKQLDDYLRSPERNRISKEIGGKIKKMQIANMYAKEAPKEVAVDYIGDWGKYALDNLRKTSPEYLAEKARTGSSVGTRLAPRAVSTVSKDDSGTPKYDNQGNLLYAPEGQRGYDWLWEQAEKVKQKAKQLKDK